MYHISNEQLSVSIDDKGAELQSIVLQTTQQEYLWNGDPTFWGKKSPVLFPIVGGLKNNSYTYKGQTYAMGRHGFAREKTFLVDQQTDKHIRFSLSADEETRKTYPFDFIFSIVYTLDQNRLTVAYEVTNTGKEPLYFSVGAHPAFAVPLLKGGTFTDHYLQFSEKENTGKWPLSPEGLIENTSVAFFTNQDKLPLQKEMFFGDALVYKDLRSNSISILNHSNKHGIQLSYTGFPYMGIWSAKNADFVCIEPWCGIADSVDASGDITEKEGINKLEPCELFTRSWTIEVF